MTVTVSELENNMNKYLALAAVEDINIVDNGKVIARLTTPAADKLKTLDSLIGVLSEKTFNESSREEQLGITR